MKGGDLDGHHLLNARKLFPEAGRQHPTTHCGLKVKTHQGQQVGHAPAMCQQLLFRGRLHGGQTEQARVVADVTGQLGLFHSL